MTRLGDHGSLELEGEVITSRQFLPAFYKQRDYQLAWSSHMDNARALSNRILASHQEGLVPADYHAAGIQHLLAASSGSKLSDAQRVDLDIMLSEALARYAYHLRFGKVNPERLDADWNIQRSFKGQDPLVELQGVIDSKAFDAQLDARISQLPLYPQLRDALAIYVAIGAAGGWPAIPAGPTLKPGMQDEDNWNREKIAAAVDTVKQQRVSLSEPVPVLLLYWTVNIGADGTLYFRDDIYQRDTKVLAGLDGQFEFDAPADAPDWLKD
jgi:murein L,D-transpeptidase YcbB/YkuD